MWGFFRYSLSEEPIFDTFRVKSTIPVEMALCGMDAYWASLGFWTITSPPFSLTDPIPMAPSEPLPDRIIATACTSLTEASD